MALVQILILTSTLVLLRGQPTLRLPPHIWRGNNTHTCPLNEDRERARNEISLNVQSHLASIMRPVSQCGGSSGWTRIAYLNMTDPAQSCPSPWTEFTSGDKRVCFRNSSLGPSCDSVIYNNPQQVYSQVCGRIIGYQHGGPHGFYPYHSSGYSIDTYYIDGISVTHGRFPRKHIWSFAAGYSESDDHGSCPCGSPTAEATIPPYIGNNYFCETGSIRFPFIQLYPDDPLWDGEGCGPGHSCECTLHSPPWFTTQLNTSTTDDIEVRICGYYPGFNGWIVGIELIELYVK